MNNTWKCKGQELAILGSNQFYFNTEQMASPQIKEEEFVEIIALDNSEDYKQEESSEKMEQEIEDSITN